MPGIQGLAPAIVAAAARLAAAGVAALVEDLLRGQGRWGDAVEDVPAKFLARDLPDMAGDINGAARFLLDHPLVVGDWVGVAGAGGGGAMALWAAVCPTIRCANAAYPASSLWRLEGIRPQALTGCHTVVHLADADHDFTRADADRMRTTLCDPGRLEVHTYPGTRRGFLDDTRPDLFHPTAAELVWQRVRQTASALKERPA